MLKWKGLELVCPQKRILLQIEVVVGYICDILTFCNLTFFDACEERNLLNASSLIIII